jgi:hypothetical protein
VTRRIRLELEIVHAGPLEREVLPALEEAVRQGDGAPLAEAARRALPRLHERKPPGPVHMPDVFAWKLAVARLEALVATSPEPPATEAAYEEVAWALLRSARAADPVTIGEDWDLLRVLVDPARRRASGIGALAATLAGEALVGSGPLMSRGGFGLVREDSYATGWNDPGRVARIARSLHRLDEKRLLRLARAIPPEVARSVWPPSPSPLVKRLPRALRALEKLREAYDAAAREGAGVFVELLLV